MTTLYLIRHAEAEGNVYHFYQGHYDSLLTPDGEAQLPLLDVHLAGVQLDAVYASDLFRARRTAMAVAAPRALPVQLRPALREMNFGIWEGRQWGDIVRSHPDSMHLSPAYLPPAGGEDMHTVGARMDDAVRSLVRDNPNRTIAAVSHGAAIRAYLCHTTGDLSHADTRLGNVSCTVLSFENADAPPRILSIGEQPEGVKQNAAMPPDLWFARATMAADAGEIRAAGFDSWLAVYGSTNSFQLDAFMENTAAMLAASRDAAFFAMKGDTRVGLLLLDTRQADEPGAGHVALVYLKPAFRGSGLGAQLLGQAMLVYRSHGRRCLRLNVARRNKQAQHLYRRHGFVPCHPILSHLAFQISMRRGIVVPSVRDDVAAGLSFVL